MVAKEKQSWSLEDILQEYQLLVTYIKKTSQNTFHIDNQQITKCQ